MSLNDTNTVAVIRQGQDQVSTLLAHFGDRGATWNDLRAGQNEAWLEMLKTHLVAMAGQVQARINEITVSTPEDFA